MKRMIFGLLIGVCVASGGAWAQDVSMAGRASVTRGQGWSVLSGRTVGQNNTVVTGQLGWPGISASLLHGIHPRLDLGLRFNFNYGYEGIVQVVEPGLKLQVVARMNLLERSRFNLGAEFAPGPLVYFFSFPTASRLINFGTGTNAGLALPLKLTLGFNVSSALLVSAGFDMPMWVTFGPGGRLWLPLLAGFGAEYFLDRNLAGTFNLRMGPVIDTRYNNGWFSLEALIGVAYRL